MEAIISWFVSPLLQLCAVACIILAVALALQVYVRRHLCTCGLRLPPGPFGLPIFGSWFLFPGGAITPKSLLPLSQKYGDLCLMKLGCRNVVIVSSPDMAKEVLQSRGIQFGSRSRNFVVKLTSAHGQDMVFSNYGAHWRKMRRITTPPFFSTEAFRSSVAMWEEEIDAALADIASTAASHKDKLSGGEVSAGNTKGIATNIRKEELKNAEPKSKDLGSLGIEHPHNAGAVDIVRRRFHLALYNMIYCMTFNRQFESMDDPVYKELDRLNQRNGMLLQSFQFNVAEFFPPLRIFFRSFIQEVSKFNHDRHQMFKDVFIKEYLEKPPAEKRRAGIDFLLDAEARGEITMKSVLLLFQNINVGALGTTISVTKWGIIELINHPHVQKKLHKELEDVLGTGACLKHKDIANLPYLQAVVKEVLRMHMAVPLLVPHLNEQQDKIGGYDIPANSRIIVNAWGIANDKRFWDKPEKFYPERFMGEKVDVYGSDYRFLPFGSGRRGCPGARMAVTVLALTFGKLVQSFELLPPRGVEKVVAVEVIGQLATVIINHLSIVLKPHYVASV